MREYLTLESESAPPEEMEVGAFCEIVSDGLSTMGTIEEVYEKEGKHYMVISFEPFEKPERVLN
jgi:hypothetical protein